MVEYTMKLITPTPPNYIFLSDGKVGSREDGMQERPKVRVADLSTKQKDEIAKAWRLSLDEVAARQDGPPNHPMKR